MHLFQKSVDLTDETIPETSFHVAECSVLWPIKVFGPLIRPRLPRQVQGSFHESCCCAHPKKIKQLAKMVEPYHFPEISLLLQTRTKRAVGSVGANQVDRFRSLELGHHRETDAGAGKSRLTGAS
jgi:hypothetical protein